MLIIKILRGVRRGVEGGNHTPSPERKKWWRKEKGERGKIRKKAEDKEKGRKKEERKREREKKEEKINKIAENP